jgi:hypothetical protein
MKNFRGIFPQFNLLRKVNKNETLLKKQHQIQQFLSKYSEIPKQIIEQDS